MTSLYKQVGKLIFLAFFISYFISCSNTKIHLVEESVEIKRWEIYTIDNSFSNREKELIQMAVNNFEKEIECIAIAEVMNLVDLEFKSPVFKTLHIRKMEKKDGDKIGLYYHNTHSIYLWTNDTREMFYKCILHELAHAFGMEGHAFKKEFSDNTQLSPIISRESFPMLYDIDIKYLQKIICGE